MPEVLKSAIHMNAPAAPNHDTMQHVNVKMQSFIRDIVRTSRYRGFGAVSVLLSVEWQNSIRIGG